jgi:hypothetical protein
MAVYIVCQLPGCQTTQLEMETALGDYLQGFCKVRDGGLYCVPVARLSDHTAGDGDSLGDYLQGFCKVRDSYQYCLPVAGLSDHTAGDGDSFGRLSTRLL